MLVGVQFHFETKRQKIVWENGKSIQVSGCQLSRASRLITYRSYNLKRWNISGGRVSRLLKSRVLCKKILTSGEQRIRLNLKTCFNSSSVILSFFLFLNRFTFALFRFYTLKWLNWEVWKNCQNMYFRIIIIVSFLKMQCAF